jgi:DNA-binding NarL/FixJ family response regulator
MIRVVIVEERTLVREALASVLASRAELSVVAQTASTDDAAALARSSNADVLVVGAPPEGGLHAARAITAAGLPTRVLVVGTCRQASPARLLAAGAAGFVGGDAHAGDLAAAIVRVHAGERLAPPPTGGPDPVALLSPRELETLRYLAIGLTNREIATRLGISVKTIDTHRGHVLKKLALRNNSDLTRFALEHGLVDLDTTPETERRERLEPRPAAAPMARH